MRAGKPGEESFSGRRKELRGQLLRGQAEDGKCHLVQDQRVSGLGRSCFVGWESGVRWAGLESADRERSCSRSHQCQHDRQAVDTRWPRTKVSVTCQHGKLGCAPNGTFGNAMLQARHTPLQQQRALVLNMPGKIIQG